MILLVHITGLTQAIFLSLFVHETVEFFKSLLLQSICFIHL